MTTTEAENKNEASYLRKRRLSKKERRALKKQRKQGRSETSEATKPSTEAAENNKNGTNDESAFLKAYEAIPVPANPSAEVLSSKIKGSRVASDEVLEGGGTSSGKTLGKWFPNAQLIKCAVSYTNTGQLMLNGPNVNKSVRVKNPRSSLVLFYQYTKKEKWSQTRLKILMTYLTSVAKKRNVGGRIRVAQEGVNATVSAVDVSGTSAQETIRHFAQDLRQFDPDVFSETDFKFIDDLPADRHFKELKVIPIQELVFYGIQENDAPLDGPEETDGMKGGVHLEAKQYHEMMGKDNTVIIDVRNHYETVIGRFDGQLQKEKSKCKDEKSEKAEDARKSGAEYLDPLMRKSTDFKSWLAKDETQEKLKDKTVLMYCTGGIRCERASAYLKKEMGSEVQGVYQLQGGIERYLKAFPDGGYWRGKNFVFDKREAVGVDNPEGDGGVIRKGDKKRTAKKKDGDSAAKCVVCSEQWDRYVGKKKCYTCGVPVLMCEKCMSLKPDKTPGMELKVRCPLCVTEKITTPASEAEFTDNGIKNKVGDNQKHVAASVLKWGGGHSTKKKQSHKAERRTVPIESKDNASE
ncbi:MAG: hypothetical protein SGBAC_010386 [Bacillariaceae sp.]